MASNETEVEVAPIYDSTLELPEGVSPLRLRADYATSLMASVFYGFYLLMVLIILRQFHRRRKNIGPLNRTHLFTLVFTIVMLGVTTGWFIASANHNSILLAGGILFIPPEERVSRLQMCNPAPMARDVFKSLQIICADGLLLWRTWVIWDASWVLLVFPVVLYLGIFGASLSYSLICLQTDILNFDDLVTVNLTQTSLSIGFNIVASGLIAYRLLHHRRSLRLAGLNPLSNRTYSTLTTIFVESAALYTICGALYLPFAQADSALIDPFALLTRCMSFLGPALIQLRIAEGTALVKGGVQSEGFRHSTALPSTRNTGSTARTGGGARGHNPLRSVGIAFAHRESVSRPLDEDRASDSSLWRAKSSEGDIEIGTAITRSTRTASPQEMHIHAK